MTARREFGAAIVACIAGAGLVLLALRQGWARVDYAAPKPLPSGSIPVSGQNLLPAADALALAALACLAAIIATRGVARRVAGLAMAGLGAWIAAQVTQPLHAATVIAASSGQAITGGLGGSLPGGNSAIGGSSATGGGLPEIGAASRVVLDSGPWRPAAVIGAAAVIAAGLLAAWRGPRWAVMSARFGRPAPQDAVASQAAATASLLVAAESATIAGSAATAGSATPSVSAAAPRPAPAARPGRPATASVSAAAPRPSAAAWPASEAGLAGHAGPGSTAPTASAAHPGRAAAERPDAAVRAERDSAELWEALDRGVDLTDTAEGDAEPVAAPARGEEP